MPLIPYDWPDLLSRAPRRRYLSRSGPPYKNGTIYGQVPPPYDPDQYSQSVGQTDVESARSGFGNLPLAWSSLLGNQSYPQDMVGRGIDNDTYQGAMFAELPQTGLLSGTLGDQQNYPPIIPDEQAGLPGGGAVGSGNPWEAMGPEAMDATRPEQSGLFGKIGKGINPILLQAGLGIMAQGGWQKMPVTLGSAIGKGAYPSVETYLGEKKWDEQRGMREEELRLRRLTSEAYADQLSAQTEERGRLAKLKAEYDAAPDLPAKMAVLQRMYPEEFMKAQIKANEPYNLGQGESRFQGSQQIANNPKEGEFAKIARDAGLEPGTPAYEKARASWLTKQTQFAPPLIGDMKIQNYQPASEMAQGEFMKEIRQSYNALKSAPATLNNIEQAKALVPKAGGFIGSGADAKREIAKFFNNNLGTSINPEGIASAEELQSRLFQQILDNLKKMDAQPSQMQQQAMQEAMGRLTTDPNALPRVLDVFADIIRDKVDMHNRDVQGSIKNNVKFPYDPIIVLPEKAKRPWEKDY
jgi:hypothetical protein